MTDRPALPFLAGLLIGTVLGVLIPDQIRSLASGAVGYLIFIVVLAAAGLLIVAGQDALESLYRAVGARLGRRSSEPEERHQNEERPPVNPWGWPNI